MLGIELLKRLGGGGGSNLIVLANDAVTGTRYCQWTLGSDGFTYKRTTAGAAVKTAAWINPQTGMSLYEVKATVLSGDVPSGTIGSWLNAGSSWTWGWAAETSEMICDLGIEIRRASDGDVIGSATISLYNSGIFNGGGTL